MAYKESVLLMLLNKLLYGTKSHKILPVPHYQRFTMSNTQVKKCDLYINKYIKYIVSCWGYTR